MTQEQQDKLRRALYNAKFTTHAYNENPFVRIYFNDLLDIIHDFGQQHPHWIPVEEELPPKRKDPLVISDKVFIRTTGVDYLSAVYDYQYEKWIDVYNIETLESNKVTHWMPIVPPRKEE